MYFISFRHLLKHPVVKSFIALKWKRLQWIYSLNIIFFMALMISITAYILLLYSRNSISTSGVFSNDFCFNSSEDGE